MSPKNPNPVETAAASPEAEAGSPAGRGLGLWAAGLALLAALLGWVFLSAATAGGDPWPQAALILGAGVLLSLARFVASVAPSLVPLGVVVGVGALLAFRADSVFGASPPTGPLGYGNASAALLVQGAVGALMVRQMWRRQWARGLGLGALVFLAVLVVFGRSRAASYLLLLLPVIALAVLRYRGPRVAVGACAVLFLAALVTTLLMARFGSPAGTEAAILDPRRILLWRDAWFLAVTNPLTGVGPGGFREESALARLDPDAAWAHHDFLQQGAETGLVGMVLLVGAFLWIYVGLWRGASRDSTSVLGAVSLTALGIHASVDYVLHFPELVLAAAALVGAGMAVQRSGRTREVDRADERRTEAQNERPKAELS